MKKAKKILLTMLVCLTVGVGAMGLVGCKDGDSSNNSSQTQNQFQNVYDMYVVYAEAQGEEILSYEEWLDSVKGNKGDQGDKGDKGDKGDQGEQGPQGPQGEQGVSVVDVDITYGTNEDGEPLMIFTFYMSDNSTIVEEVVIGKTEEKPDDGEEKPDDGEEEPDDVEEKPAVGMSEEEWKNNFYSDTYTNFSFTTEVTQDGTYIGSSLMQYASGLLKVTSTLAGSEENLVEYYDDYDNVVEILEDVLRFDIAECYSAFTYDADSNRYVATSEGTSHYVVEAIVEYDETNKLHYLEVTHKPGSPDTTMTWVLNFSDYGTTVVIKPEENPDQPEEVDSNIAEIYLQESYYTVEWGGDLRAVIEEKIENGLTIGVRYKEEVDGSEWGDVPATLDMFDFNSVDTDIAGLHSLLLQYGGVTGGVVVIVEAHNDAVANANVVRTLEIDPSLSQTFGVGTLTLYDNGLSASSEGTYAVSYKLEENGSLFAFFNGVWVYYSIVETKNEETQETVYTLTLFQPEGTPKRYESPWYIDGQIKWVIGVYEEYVNVVIYWNDNTIFQDVGVIKAKPDENNELYVQGVKFILNDEDGSITIPAYENR